jgi:hypothetical protein
MVIITLYQQILRTQNRGEGCTETAPFGGIAILLFCDILSKAKSVVSLRQAFNAAEKRFFRPEHHRWPEFS